MKFLTGSQKHKVHLSSTTTLRISTPIAIPALCLSRPDLDSCSILAHPSLPHILHCDKIQHFLELHIMFVTFEFSQNFNVENLENLECVKTTPETNYKICLMINIQGFCDKEILHIF